MFRLKHDVQQAQYLISKDYKLEGIEEFQKIGDEILIVQKIKKMKIIIIKNIINSDEIKFSSTFL